MNPGFQISIFCDVISRVMKRWEHEEHMCVTVKRKTIIEKALASLAFQ